MNSPDEKTLRSAAQAPPGMQVAGVSPIENSSLPVRTDRLYQIAAVAVGLILLATAL